MCKVEWETDKTCNNELVVLRDSFSPENPFQVISYLFK